MTENKRFTNVEVDDYYNLICVNDGDTFHSYSEKALEDLLNELHEENTQLKNKLKFLNELNEPYGVIIEENIRLKAFIKRLTNNCGEIILMNGIGYNVDKILGDFE